VGAQLRVYRRRIKSVQSTKKITKAMEMIASSRIAKAQQRLNASIPYTTSLIGSLSSAISAAEVDHPLTTEVENPRRAAVLLITADRGLAGAYSISAIKTAEGLAALLQKKGLEVQFYIVGRKGINFFKFRDRELAGSWMGFTDRPEFVHAKEISDSLLSAFRRDTATEDGVDEIHVVYTNFESMGQQDVRIRRLLPYEVVEQSGSTDGGDSRILPLFDFEPGLSDVLDALLPRFLENLVFSCLLFSSASEHAARRRAMKAATDNAEELIKSLVRQSNQARQSEITQEISEIVGGADALSSASAGS
jgi:F-type H+-transporting ATPase subunit gamma